MENYIVYKIANLINDKIYIGQTIRTLEERFKAHYYDDESNIGNAIRQYGRENFTIEVIEKCDSKEELNAYENYYIAYFDSKEPKGYNQIGGDIDAIDKYYDKIFGKDGWFSVFQDALIWLGHQNITGEQLRVLCNLLGRMEFDNRIIFKTKDIATSIGIHPNQVSRALKVLRDKEIIYKDPKNEKVYKLNPHIGHKGIKTYSRNVVEFADIQAKSANKQEEKLIFERVETLD